jgi:hypothetical protein
MRTNVLYSKYLSQHEKEPYFGRQVRDMIRQTNMITTQIIINYSLPMSIYVCNTNWFSLSRIFGQFLKIFLWVLP